MRRTEEFQYRQEALKIEAEHECESEARQKLEKRLEDLKAGLIQHTLDSTHSHGVSLPVPAFRAKYSSFDTPKEVTLSGHTASSMSQDLPEDDAIDSSTRNYNSDSTLQNNNTNNIVEDNVAKPPQRDSSIQYPLHNRTTDHIQLNEKYLPQINNMEYSVCSSDSEYLLNNYSVAKETSEPITTTYHRPPTEIIKAAGYTNTVQSFHDGNYDRNALELPEPRTRHSELPTEGIQCVSSLQPQDSNKCKKKLDDTLPIPILRAPSPVIPAVRIGQVASGSDAVRTLEAKWQVWYCSVLHPSSLLALFCKEI
jgi:hypothetical protein